MGGAATVWTWEEMRATAGTPLLTSPEADPRGYTNPAPFTRRRMSPFEVRNLVSQVGRLFFTTSQGNGSCSATVIGRHLVHRQYTMVLTAGHCVHPGGTGNNADGFTNFVFVPAYDGTKACPGAGCPYGVWNDRYTWGTKNAWINQANVHCDLGGVVFRPGRQFNPARTLYEVVGFLGVACGESRVNHWVQLGYPVEVGTLANKTNNGNRMIQCMASFASKFDGGRAGTPQTRVGCDVGHGASGGPWILGYGTRNLVNGVNSQAWWTNAGRILALSTPYFGSEARSFVNWQKNYAP